mmetsp:Transcript_90552/g.255635  ORF Transcript_90552/g.255635 Transcript_90552/m.255635 type:complete len:148 (-) Transcript_90552:202-645(-)
MGCGASAAAEPKQPADLPKNAAQGTSAKAAVQGSPVYDKQAAALTAPSTSVRPEVALGLAEAARGVRFGNPVAAAGLATAAAYAARGVWTPPDEDQVPDPAIAVGLAEAATAAAINGSASASGLIKAAAAAASALAQARAKTRDARR